MITNYKKPTWPRTLCGCVVLLALGAVSMTTLAQKEEELINEPSIDELMTLIDETPINEPPIYEPRTLESETEISADDPMIKIAELQLELARKEAERTIEIEYARAAWTVAVAKVERIKSTNQETPNTISKQEVLEAELKRTLAQKQYEKALYNLNVLKPLEVKLRERELDFLKALTAARRGVVLQPEETPEFHQVRIADVRLEQAKALENETIDIEMAKAAWAVALAEVQQKNEVNVQTPNTVSPQEMLETDLRKTQAKKQYEKALYDLSVVRPIETKIKEQELEIAKARMQRNAPPIESQIVNDFLTCLVEKKYDIAYRMGDVVFRSKISQERLQSIAETIDKDFGAFQSRRVTRVHRVEEFTDTTSESFVYRTAWVLETRENGSVIYRISVNDANQVVGFFVESSEKR